MISWLRRLLGLGGIPDLAALKREGVAILDVRTKAEYAEGHIPGTQNIPLNTLAENIHRWKKDQPIITCCASGMRSGQAAAILRGRGFTRVYNGGGWRSLQARWKAAGPGNAKHI